jgi:hypothetical protein
MALPKIKEKIYTHFLKGIGKEIRFRGFTVKEQEILLESLPIKDLENKEENLTKEQEIEIVNAICQVITNCIIDNIDAKDLTYFDLTDLFIQLRKVSVGDVIELKYQLTHPDEKDERKRYEIVNHIVDLNKIEVKVPDSEKMNIVIDNEDGMEYIVRMKFPSVRDIIDDDKKAIKENVIASKIFSMVDVISVDGEIYTKDDITLDEWIESFTTFGSFNQQKFVDFIKNIPDVEYEFDIVSNRNPKVKHTIHLKGLKDFF